MELWIRSQDRNVLMPINSKLELLYDAPEHILIISANTILGAYKSRQRVLEVLDEIQNLILIRFVVENSTYEQADIEVKGHILCNMSKIYEMPQE